MAPEKAPVSLRAFVANEKFIGMEKRKLRGLLDDSTKSEDKGERDKGQCVAQVVFLVLVHLLLIVHRLLHHLLMRQHLEE